jgi:hypothetical protein
VHEKSTVQTPSINNTNIKYPDEVLTCFGCHEHFSIPVGEAEVGLSCQEVDLLAVVLEEALSWVALVEALLPWVVL